MKRSLRFALLVTLLGLSSWLSMHPKAQADDMPYCGDISGTFCPFIVGYYITCWNTYNDYSTCTCSPYHTWWCE